MSFTCPRCMKVSHNLFDEVEGYCGACHDFTGSTQEADRLADVVPFVEQEEERPAFLPPDKPDHEWVTALERDLLSRTEAYRPADSEIDVRIPRDRSIWDMSGPAAWVLGYQQAIHHLRELSNGDGMEVVLLTADDIEEITRDSAQQSE